MSQSEQAGKMSPRKLGRGLSALLGKPVQIRAQGGSSDAAPTNPPASAPASTSAVAGGTAGSSAASTDSSTTARVDVPRGTSAQTSPPSSPSADVPRGTSSQAAASQPAPPDVPRGTPGTSESAGGPTPGATGRIARPSYSMSETASASNDPESMPELCDLPVAQIRPNRRQPRTDFDEASIKTLAASIERAGLMQPIMVRPAPWGYELVAGERRWRASKLLGLPTIPAFVRSVNDQTAAELALIENVQREDLNPMDRALALKRLAVDFSMTHNEIADRVGLDRASVSNLLRLSELDPESAKFVRQGILSQSHGKALLAVTDLQRRLDLARRASREEWSVRELERRVQQANAVKPVLTRSSESTESAPRSANVADLEQRLSTHLGTPVTIQLGRKKGSGRLIIEFFSLDQFDGLMQRVGFDPNR